MHYIARRRSLLTWSVEYTDQFETWWSTLEEDEQEAIDAAVEALEERGPGLGRPLVDNVHQSKHTKMKEVRPLGATIRILFAFDPRRTAILLVGGDKAGQWNRWYQEHVPVAHGLYDDHLAELELEGNENE